jgi:hypothetical protein
MSPSGVEGFALTSIQPCLALHRRVAVAPAWRLPGPICLDCRGDRPQAKWTTVRVSFNSRGEWKSQYRQTRSIGPRAACGSQRRGDSLRGAGNTGCTSCTASDIRSNSFVIYVQARRLGRDDYLCTGLSGFLQRIRPRNLLHGGRRLCKWLPDATFHTIIKCRTGFHEA